MAKNSGLQEAQKAKKDEFYTQLSDISDELRHYRKHFKNATVMCNCDDPFESNFFKYFALNFNKLGLKKLIATCYKGSPVVATQLSFFDGMEASVELNKEANRKAYKIIITEVPDTNGDGAIDITDVEWLIKNGNNVLTELEGDGDFRSDECVELLKEADIVVTNPPFSLFRPYVAQLIEYDKKFLIIGNMNALTYKEIFPLIKDNKMWPGYRFNKRLGGKNMTFMVPDSYEMKGTEMYEEDGKKYISVAGTGWYTNLDIKKIHEPIELYKKYSPEEYPKYDNYDAINVDVTAEIPKDYYGIMGVPVSFIDKYCPEQFEILGLTSGRKEFAEEAWPIKRYINAIQHNKDGSTANGSKANTRATLICREPKGVYYTADNADEKMEIVYARILIRRIDVEE